MFGTAVQSEMDEAERRSKSKNPRGQAARNRMILNKWIPAPKGQTKGRFKDPAAG